MEIIYEGILAQERTRGSIGPHAQQRNIFPFSSTSTNTNIPSTSVALSNFLIIQILCSLFYGLLVIGDERATLP